MQHHLPLGLVVPSFIIFPLTLGVVALLSAIAASWVSNLFTSDPTYSRLLPIIGMTEIVAVGDTLLNNLKAAPSCRASRAVCACSKRRTRLW